MAKKEKEVSSKIQDLENQLKRALADYDNLQKRVLADKQDFIKLGKTEVIKKLLGVLDNLEQASKLEGSENFESLKQGVEIAKQEFKKILESEGIQEIKADEGFDPYYHEAVEVVNGDEDNKVVEVIQKGYKSDEKVIRPSLVKVSKKG